MWTARQEVQLAEVKGEVSKANTGWPPSILPIKKKKSTSAEKATLKMENPHGGNQSANETNPPPPPFWIVVLEKILESPLDSKEIKPVNPKRNQYWIFIGRTGAEAETPIVWPPDERADSLEKTLMLGKTEGRRRRGWQRMRSLDPILDWTDMSLSKLWEIVKVCCSPWGHNESDTT